MWKQLLIFYELWDVKMTYLNKFEMVHYLKLYIVLAFCPGRLIIFFLSGNIIDPLESSTCVYEMKSRNVFSPLKEWEYLC